MSDGTLSPEEIERIIAGAGYPAYRPTNEASNKEAFMSDEVLSEGKKAGDGAKGVSLKSMLVSAVWIGALSLLKAFWGLVSEKPFGLTMNEVVLSGVIMAAVFSPVYLSIILDKIKDIKVG